LKLQSHRGPPARSRSVSSWAAPMCLVTNGEYTDSVRRFRDIVTGIAGRGQTRANPRKLEHCRRSGRRVDGTPRIPGVARQFPASLEPAVVPMLEVYEDGDHHKAIESVFLLQRKPFAEGSASLRSCGFAETEVDRDVALLSFYPRESRPQLC
jgi:hypothetical protein